MVSFTEKNMTAWYVYRKSEDGQKSRYVHFITYNFSNDYSTIYNIVLLSNNEVPYITDINSDMKKEEANKLVIRSISTVINL